MEFILIAWFSMMDIADNSDTAYGYGFATSIVQEFNSEQACSKAGWKLQRSFLAASCGIQRSTYPHRYPGSITYAGHTHNHAKRLFKSAVNELSPVADGRNVTLAIEPMHAGCAGAWTFLTDLDETLEMLAWIDNPRLKLVFDAYHFGQDPAVVARLAELVPMIALVQLGDARVPPNGEQNRCRLGDGSVPLKEIVSSVLQGGYDGYFDVELMGEDLDCPDYLELIEQSKSAFADLQA